MKRTLIHPELEKISPTFHPLLVGAAVYDSSCSPEARVLYIEKDGGCFLKSAPKGTLQKEAALTGYFHTRHLAAEVLAYESSECDWLLTARVPGEDCTHAQYLSDPVRLCETTAELLRRLHDMPADNCPVSNRTDDYLAAAAQNRRAGCFDRSYLAPDLHRLSTDKVWQIVENCGALLKTDTLLHGDYCLPNIVLEDWRFSGFIDLDHSGVGDRHIDLYWGLWTLWRNLGTDQYCGRFLDVYGREKVDIELLKLVSAIEAFG